MQSCDHPLTSITIIRDAFFAHPNDGTGRVETNEKRKRRLRQGWTHFDGRLGCDKMVQAASVPRPACVSNEPTVKRARRGRGSCIVISIKHNGDLLRSGMERAHSNSTYIFSTLMVLLCQCFWCVCAALLAWIDRIDSIERRYQCGNSLSLSLIQGRKFGLKGAQLKDSGWNKCNKYSSFGCL